MHAGGVSAGPLIVSDSHCYCDPDHLQGYVCRDKERAMALMATPNETQTDDIGTSIENIFTLSICLMTVLVTGCENNEFFCWRVDTKTEIVKDNI